MERKSSRHKFLRRKIKHYAATVAGAAAGAAILTGAALPGVPAATALAAERPSVDQSNVKAAQVVKLDENSFKDYHKERPSKEKRRNYGWHEHRYSWPGPNENHVLYKDGRLYYRSDSSRYSDYAYSVSSPVDFVKDYASRYGFDRYRDSFTLVSQSSRSASVQVRQARTGRFFRVDLIRAAGYDWTIARVQSL